MARVRQDLNLFYGNCDLDLGNIQAWEKNSVRLRRNSNTKEGARCVRACRKGREGKNREVRQRMEKDRLIDLVVTLRLTSIFESIFFLVPLDELAVIQSLF